MYIKQLDSTHWVKGVANPVAHLKYTPRDITLSRGIQFEYNEGEPGLGEIEEALLESSSGHIFGLIRYPQAPAKKYTAIFLDENLTDATAILDTIMIDLELQSSDFLLLNLRLYQFRPVQLFRLDDNGNRFLIGDFNCYPDALRQQSALEHRGHKQCYFIEPGLPKPEGWTGTWTAATKSQLSS